MVDLLLVKASTDLNEGCSAGEDCKFEYCFTGKGKFTLERISRFTKVNAAQTRMSLLLHAMTEILRALKGAVFSVPEKNEGGGTYEHVPHLLPLIPVKYLKERTCHVQNMTFL